MPTIAHHVGTIDGTNMSRKINWVQDEEETEFLFSEEQFETPLHTYYI